MKWFFVLLSLYFISTTACSDDNSTSKNIEQKNTKATKAKKEDFSKGNLEDVKLEEYFYPTDSLEPYIYAFQEKNNPIDEKLHRHITKENDDGDTVFIIERYNSNFKIFEGFTLDLNESLKILDHMMVDKNGIKRSSRLTKDEYFPKNIEEQSKFIADFPSHLDSIIMVYESRKHVEKTGVEITVLGEQKEAITIIDSINVHMVHVANKKRSTQKVVSRLYFAKGMGLVSFGDTDGEVTYELKRIFSNEWWMNNAI